MVCIFKDQWVNMTVFVNAFQAFNVASYELSGFANNSSDFVPSRRMSHILEQKGDG